MQASQVPTKFPIAFGSGAGSGYTRQIPQASQIGVTPGAASLIDGFPPLTFLPVNSGGVPPFGQDFNGLLTQITAWNRWQASGGPAVYDGTFSAAIGGYPQGASLLSTSGQYYWLSTVDNNTTNPEAGGAGWTKLAFPTDQSLWHQGVASGTNAITTTLTPVPAANAIGFFISLVTTATNTGAASLTFAGTQYPVVLNTASLPALTGGEIPVPRANFYFDGANAVLLNPQISLATLYKSALSASAFTSGVVLSDMATAGTDYVAQSVSITGAAYIDAQGSCAFANQSNTVVGFTARLDLLGVSPTGPYLGAGGNLNVQAPASVAARWTGLDPTATYTLRLLVKKNANVGPVYVNDTRILANYGK